MTPGPALAIAFGPMPLGDAMLLRAGLRVAGVNWRTVTREKCDVFFSINLTDLPPARDGGPRCVVAGPRRASAVPALFLDRWPSIAQIPDVIRSLRAPRDVAAPPRAASPRASAPGGSSAGHAAPAGPTAAATGATVDRWLEDVARAETRDRLLHVTTTNGPVALLDPVNRSAWLAPSAAGHLVAALTDTAPTAEPVPRTAPPSTAIRASLAHFLWAIALATRWQPNALGVDPARLLKLRRWPDFGSLERRDTFLRAASQLTRQPVSLQSLLGAFPKHGDDVLAFIAGCRLCGWLEVTADIDDNAPPAAPAATPGRLQNAIGALRRALGINGAAR